MTEGKLFEKTFADSIKKEKFWFHRIKDTSAPWNNTGDTRGFTAKNPYDLILFGNYHLFLLELKSTKGTSFSFSEKIIKAHQIKKLLEASTFDRINAGFIFNFRTTDKTYFISIQDFVQFKESSGKQSINEKDCINIGILINQTTKKVHNHYHICELIDAVILSEVEKSRGA